MANRSCNSPEPAKTVDLGTGCAAAESEVAECHGEVSRSRQALPSRVADRPHPEMWSDDELLTLSEAASLFWPAGPLTTSSLRHAVSNGLLGVVEIAGKLLTNKAAIERMSICRPRHDRDSAQSAGSFPRTVAEFRRHRQALAERE